MKAADSRHMRLVCLFALATGPALSGCGSTGDLQPPTRVYVGTGEFVYDGEITDAANAALVDLAANEHSPPGRLRITSTGGDIAAGMALGLWVHGQGLDVYVPEYCLSSCANYVFTAGHRKLLGENAFLLWHGGATQEGLYDCEDCRRYEDDPRFLAWRMEMRARESAFFKKIGVDQSITVLGQLPDYRCHENPPYDGWYYSRSDLAMLGVDNVTVQGSRWQPIPPSDKISACQLRLR